MGRLVTKVSEHRELFTIGHSTHSAGEFIEILHAFGVTRLIDIRRFPGSRTNPQFNRDTLPKVLISAGISYVYLENLGGRRAKIPCVAEDLNAGWEHRAFHNYADYAQTATFRKGLRELLKLASNETCAIMCAEAVWWRCHRRIVTDHVLAHGAPVVHIFTLTKSEPASLTPFAVVGANTCVSYPEPAAASRQKKRKMRSVLNSSST